MSVGWFALRSWVLNVVVGFESGASVGTEWLGSERWVLAQVNNLNGFQPGCRWQKWDSDSEVGWLDKMEVAGST